MRKVFRTIVVLAVAAVTMSACKKERREFHASDGIKVDFVTQSLDTRTEFGTAESGSIPVLWKAGDKVKVIAHITEGEALEVTPSSDFKTGSFSATLPTSFPYVVYALSPSSSFVSAANNSTYGDYIQYMIPAYQAPVDGNIAPSAQVLFAKTEELTEEPSSALSVHFKHLAAYGKISLTNIPEGKAIKGITLDFSTDKVGVAGRFIYTQADDKFFINPNSMAYSITIKTTQTENVYFGVAPVDISGKSMTVSVEVEGGNYRKTITIPSGKEFKSGVVSSFTIDMSGAEPDAAKVYTLVTDLSTLAEGDEIIIASEKIYDTPNVNGHSVLSTQYNTNNIQAVCIEECFDGTRIVNPPAGNVDAFTLEKSSISGTWLFKSASQDGYLARQNSGPKKNYATSYTASEIEENEALLKSASWSVSEDNSDTHSVIMKSNSPLAYGSGYGGYLRTNVTEDGKTYIFSCYGDKDGEPKQDPICLYRYEASETPEPEKVLTVERLWGKYGSEAGPWYSYFTTSENCSRNIAMDDNYIFMPETQANPVLWKIPIDGTTAPSLMPVGTVDGGGTFALCCARIIPNVKEAVNSGKDYVLGMTNLAINQDTYFYYYRNGIDHDPVKVLIRTSGTNRRLGDKFTWNGTINEGKIWLNDAYDSNDQGAVITAYMKWTDIQEDGWPARITMFKEGPSASGIVAAGYAYPDYTDPLNVTSNVLYTSANNACLVSDIATNSSTVDEFSGNGWYKNAAGFQFFEFEGKKYIAYAKMETTTQSRLIIIEDLGSGAQFKQTLHAHNVVFQAPIQHESNFDFESPTPSVHGCVDCSVRIINGEPYIAVMHQNVGLSLFKMSMK